MREPSERFGLAAGQNFFGSKWLSKISFEAVAAGHPTQRWCTREFAEPFNVQDSCF